MNAAHPQPPPPPRRLFWTTIAAVCLLVWGGCRQKSESKSALDNATKALQQPEVAAAPPAGAPPQLAANAPRPAQEIKVVQASLQSGNFEDAVVRLQKLRALPVLSPPQRIAVNDAIAAVMSEIYAQASKGDARAKAALKAYERMQTERR